MSQRTRRGLAAWLTASHTPIFVLDHRRVVLVFNKGCEELTGWSAGEVIGKTCQFLSVSVPDQIDCLTGALCPPEAAFQSEFVISPTILQHKTGEILERTIQFYPLTKEDDEDGKVRVLGVISNTVERFNERVLPHFELQDVTAKLYQKYGISRLIATSPASQQVAEQVALAKKSQASVWVTGEAGSGKEHHARLIHYASGDRTGQFIPIRCRTSSHFEIQRLLKQLQENITLQATIYFECVDQLSRDLQEVVIELLETHPQVRWISSTEKELSITDDARFSSSLKYRLSTIRLHLQSLKDRLEELPLLAQQILEDFNQGQTAQREGFDPHVKQQFLQYNWPGNLDELSKVIQSAWSTAKKPLITIEDLPLDFRIGFDAQQIGLPEKNLPLDQYLEKVEREEITRVLSRMQGNKTQAAKALGMPRAKFYRRLESLGIDAKNQSDLSENHTKEV